MSQTDPIRISLDEDRFDRLRLIPWWDQERLAKSTALVLGAGALGNELVKNLALLGIGRLVVVDFDRVEHSNLSRSVLFRLEDEDRPKCDVAVEAARRIYPDIDAVALNKDIVFELGRGWYLDADVVLTGLDGRECRLVANRACACTRKPLFDGAIEGIDGVVRSFLPHDGPCYECTMSEKDWDLIRHRRSCNLLSHDDMMSGHIPTTSTISSIIAGLQVQQAVKHLHDLDAQFGTGLHIHGHALLTDNVTYQRQPECFAHDVARDIEQVPWHARTHSVEASLAAAESVLGSGVALELRHDIVTSRRCRCGYRDETLAVLLRLPTGSGVCPECGSELHFTTTHSLRRGTVADNSLLSDVGIPEYDIVRFRSGIQTWDVLLAAEENSLPGKDGSPLPSGPQP